MDKSGKRNLAHAYVCVCVHVCEIERERGRKGERERHPVLNIKFIFLIN